MNYKAVEVIWIFGADGRTDPHTDRGVPRGPRGPKKDFLQKSAEKTAFLRDTNQDHLTLEGHDSLNFKDFFTFSGVIWKIWDISFQGDESAGDESAAEESAGDKSADNESAAEESTTIYPHLLKSVSFFINFIVCQFYSFMK